MNTSSVKKPYLDDEDEESEEYDKISSKSFKRDSRPSIDITVGNLWSDKMIGSMNITDIDINKLWTTGLKRTRSAEEEPEIENSDSLYTELQLQHKDISNPIVSKLLNYAKNLESELEATKTKLNDQSNNDPSSRKNSMFQNRLHFAFLFSSPLIRKMNGKLQSIMQLNYEEELREIYKIMDDVDYTLKFRSEVATRENFCDIITDRPVVLHFSGHGIENNKKNLGSDYTMNKQKGHVLLFENENGMSDYYFEQELKTLLNISKYEFELVFVSSCHSQFAGQVFLNAGAQHVICIIQNAKVLDEASTVFSKVFYETLFSKNYTICDSFQIAKTEVAETIDK